VFYCPYCDKGEDADYNASVNILNRINDNEITLYTPYKQVKEILMSRIHTDVGDFEKSFLGCTEPSKTQDTYLISPSESELYK
jgi:hypothetical protein